jgi:hypothetical protein
MRKIVFMSINFDANSTNDFAFEINRLRSEGYELFGFQDTAELIPAEKIAQNTQFFKSHNISVDAIKNYADDLSLAAYIKEPRFDSIYYGVSLSRPALNWDETQGYVIDKVIYGRLATVQFTLKTSDAAIRADKIDLGQIKKMSPYSGENIAYRSSHTEHDGINIVSIAMIDDGYRSDRLSSALSSVNTNFWQRLGNSFLKVFSTIKNIFSSSTTGQVTPTTSGSSDILNQLKASQANNTTPTPTTNTATTPTSEKSNATYSIFETEFSIKGKSALTAELARIDRDIAQHDQKQANR